MSTEWSLKEIYPSFESEEFQRDFERFSNFREVFNGLTLEDNLESIKAAIATLEEFSVLSSRLGNYINLTLTANTTDETANKYRTLFGNAYAALNSAYTKVYKFIGSVETDITADENLKDYEFYFAEAKQQYKHLLSDELEDVIAKFSISGGDGWEQLFEAMTSGVEGEFKGEKVTLSEIRNMAYDADAAVRKEAYETELKMYDTIKEPIAFALNNIKQQVLTETSLRGFESPLAQTLEASRMSRQTLDALLEAIREYLPQFRAYLKHKAALLGHENGLPFYDLFAPIGESSRRFTIEESKEFL